MTAPAARDLWLYRRDRRRPLRTGGPILLIGLAFLAGADAAAGSPA
jgi:hypothetical protein